MMLDGKTEEQFNLPNNDPASAATDVSGLYNPPVCYCIPNVNKDRKSSTWIAPQFMSLAATVVLAYF